MSAYQAVFVRTEAFVSTPLAPTSVSAPPSGRDITVKSMSTSALTPHAFTDQPAPTSMGRMHAHVEQAGQGFTASRTSTNATRQTSARTEGHV